MVRVKKVESPMRTNKANGASQARSNHGKQLNDGPSDFDPLQELVWIADEESELDESEREDVGDLGNEQDAAEDFDAVLDEFSARAPTRLNWLMHRAVDCMRTLRAMKTAPCGPWPEDRIPEEHWRALADEALGLIGKAVKAELETQKIVRDAPIEERHGLQRYLDTSIGMKMFRQSFEQEREAWERAYWLRGLDESFGKRKWSGPEGWRAAFEPRYVDKRRPPNATGEQSLESR